MDAFSRDDQNKLATGKLLTIDNQIDPTTGTAKLKAVFDNKDNRLWPNQFVNADLLLETRKNSTVVPTAAILRGPQGTYVYAVNPDKTVRISQSRLRLPRATRRWSQRGESGRYGRHRWTGQIAAGSHIEPRDECSQARDAGPVTGAVSTSASGSRSQPTGAERPAGGGAGNPGS